MRVKLGWIPKLIGIFLIIAIFAGINILWTTTSFPSISNKRTSEDRALENGGYINGSKPLLFRSSASLDDILSKRLLKQSGLSTSGSIRNAPNTGGPLYITTNQMGHLGNSMFQYASLLGLAHANGRTAFVPFTSNVRKVFEITHAMDVPESKTWSSMGEANHGKYDIKFENLPEVNLSLIAYLQSYKYFQSIEPQVRKEFKFREGIKRRALSLLKQIWPQVAGRTPVGVHVRRSDLFTTKERILGSLAAPKTYFEKAFQWMRAKHGKVVFLVATDDVVWTSANIISGDDVILLPEASGDIHMCALSLCRHVIMSVGTFGWWAGWLSGGDVVYYNQQHRPGSWKARRFSNADFFPQNWIGIGDSSATEIEDLSEKTEIAGTDSEASGLQQRPQPMTTRGTNIAVDQGLPHLPQESPNAMSAQSEVVVDKLQLHSPQKDMVITSGAKQGGVTKAPFVKNANDQIVAEEAGVSRPAVQRLIPGVLPGSRNSNLAVAKNNINALVVGDKETENGVVDDADVQKIAVGNGEGLQGTAFVDSDDSGRLALPKPGLNINEDSISPSEKFPSVLSGPLLSDNEKTALQLDKDIAGEVSHNELQIDDLGTGYDKAATLDDTSLSNQRVQTISALRRPPESLNGFHEINAKFSDMMAESPKAFINSLKSRNEIPEIDERTVEDTFGSPRQVSENLKIQERINDAEFSEIAPTRKSELIFERNGLVQESHDLANGKTGLGEGIVNTQQEISQNAGELADDDYFEDEGTEFGHEGIRPEFQNLGIKTTWIDGEQMKRPAGHIDSQLSVPTGSHLFNEDQLKDNSDEFIEELPLNRDSGSNGAEKQDLSKLIAPSADNDGISPHSVTGLSDVTMGISNGAILDNELSTARQVVTRRPLRNPRFQRPNPFVRREGEDLMSRLLASRSMTSAEDLIE